MTVYLENIEDFQKEVASGNVLIDFYATWCGPCRMMSRVIEDIEEKLPYVKFLKIDTDKFPEIAQHFGVMSIPTFVAYKDGRRINVDVEGQKMTELIGGRDEDLFFDIIRTTFGLN